jgi:thiol-disulfide isomerase/thioredoxin
LKPIVLALCLLVPMVCVAAGAGDPAPACNLASFADGKPVSLNQPGKVLYVDFWASWCGPCAQSVPFLNKMHEQLKAKGFEVIAVNLDEERGDADEFLAKHPAKFTVAANPDGNCPNLFQVAAMPSSYLVDKHGKIRHVQLGFRNDEAEGIQQKVQALLVEP